MHKLICDFCAQEIRPSETFITVSVEMSETILGTSWDAKEMHFHTECGTRLRNKINQFVADARERKENDDRTGVK